MSARTRFGYAAILSIACAAALPCVSLGGDAVQVQPDVANSRYQFTGAINDSNVYIRSGPGEEWYSTLKLDKGAPVTVVGIQGDWLKILPPTGSFCYVSKMFVNKAADGAGQVTHNGINVRAGSVISPLKTTVLGKLSEGDSVTITGERDEYYEIAPPPDTYLYVKKDFVDPLKALAVAAAPVDEIAPLDAEAPAPGNGPATQPAVAESAPAAKPAAPQAAPAPVASAADLALAAFKSAETDFDAAMKMPLEHQPLAELAKRYDALSTNTALDEADRQTAGFRLAMLKVRGSSQQRLMAQDQADADAARQQQALQAEQDELQKQLDEHEVRIYSAVGQLQPSSLQFGSETLYRLIDPATGRTVIYVRGDDATAAKLMGQFVGVRGEAAVDGQLNVKVIPFSVMEIVDPAQVNGKVVAGIIPPSMAAQAVQAGASN